LREQWLCQRSEPSIYAGLEKEGVFMHLQMWDKQDNNVTGGLALVVL
jgi:hypothetical protein